MNETDRTTAVHQYIDELIQQLRSGQAREHAYRPALQRLMSSFDDVNAINDPARSENGNPDFVFLKNSNRDIILGYAEAKDITVDLDKTLKTEQLRRYAGYEKLFLTNYRDFIFLSSGEEYLRISIGKLDNGTLVADHSQTLRLMNELQAFLEKKPEAIKSGKRLAVIMGGKARRIRDNVSEYLAHPENEHNIELDKIYGLMKKLLVHDLSEKQFADLYAQTLVYGLFAARYNDNTPESFDRREAVESIPKTNPFLRQFFNHIAGADFDARLRYIVDELCEVFSISDIRALVRHQATKFAVDDEQDLTIHFYEDFLKEYDPVMRQKMGVYYTPVPVVRYIVRSVDRILREEFGIADGLASSETIDHWIETGQDHRSDRRQKAQTGYYKKLPRVQVLDPAVGTATFLNETIKHIYKQFEGQEGRWPAYVRDNLVKRLHGFELMMAPYTIAHLKLSMTLRETGADDLSDRLGVYLTNTLEEGVPVQGDMFTMFGLAEAVSEESRQAAEIKTNQPIMVVMGNPPYSVSSNNKSKWIQNLIVDYKKDLNERKINLDDDYIKFIRFAEEMIAKNGSGVVAMITNNSYIDGITHRQMRKHLLQTFDKIYVLDLHGNAKKKEVAPDGSQDGNVFDIMQGVSVVLMVKTGKKQEELGEVYHAELWGKRRTKFDILNGNQVNYVKITVTEPNFYFVPRDTKGYAEYQRGIAVNKLFIKTTSGIQTNRDIVVIDSNKETLVQRITRIADLAIPDDVITHETGLKDTREKTVGEMRTLLQHVDIPTLVERIAYRILDDKWIFYSDILVLWTRMSEMKNYLSNDNVGLVVCRQTKTDWHHVFITNKIVESSFISNKTSEYGYSSPLYIYHEDGTRTPNFATTELSKLTTNLSTIPSPEDTLDYIYAVLHSPSYRAKYREFLKLDFPRIPVPTQAEFDRLIPLGRKLRELHLMESQTNYDTTFPQAGDNIVEKPYFIDGKVYINNTQYFGNVPQVAWDFYIGGYQPAQKWLKDRKGRTLDDAELRHYQNIITILTGTDRIMKRIG